MFDLALLFILGLSIVNSLLLLWFFSPIKITLSELFLGKSLMPLEFDDYVYSKSKFFGKLNTCWICCSFWLSLTVGVIFCYVSSLTLLWPLITFLSYPAFCYIFYTFIKR